MDARRILSFNVMHPPWLLFYDGLTITISSLQSFFFRPVFDHNLWECSLPYGMTPILYALWDSLS